MNFIKTKLFPFLLTFLISLLLSITFEIKDQPISQTTTVAVHIYKYPTNRLPKPNPLLLWVDIDDKDQIKLNGENYGFAHSPNSLKQKLTEVFEARRDNGVFKEYTDKVVKDVIVSSSNSIKYEDFMKVIKAIEDAGSDLIQIDTQHLVKKNQKTLFPIVCTRYVNSK
ncbi:MAG: biopolymer transporter ExbD [Acidobacteriota bacterium]